MLERQGVVVDAFLDLKDRTIKGSGITEKTEYFIYGEKPLISSAATLDANPVTQAALDVMGKMEEMKKKAVDLGAQPVQVRRFLLLMGYKLPKGVDTSDISASSYLRAPVQRQRRLDDAKGRQTEVRIRGRTPAWRLNLQAPGRCRFLK